MDKNKVKSISRITSNLHDETDSIYEALMDNDLKDAGTAIDNMVETLKHLKSNLKENEV